MQSYEHPADQVHDLADRLRDLALLARSANWAVTGLARVAPSSALDALEHLSDRVAGDAERLADELHQAYRGEGVAAP